MQPPFDLSNFFSINYFFVSGILRLTWFGNHDTPRRWLASSAFPAVWPTPGPCYSLARIHKKFAETILNEETEEQARSNETSCGAR
jgi:hypothetical protein